MFIITLDQSMMAKVNRDIGPRINSFWRTMTSWFWEVVKVNPLILFGYKAAVDPHDFLDCVYKVLTDIGVTCKVKGELASYKLRDVSKVRNTQ